MSGLVVVDRPELLWIGLVVVGAILFGWWRHSVRRRRLAAFLGGARAVGRLSRSNLYRIRLERAALLGAAGVAIAFAGAEVRWADAPPEPPPPPPKNVVLALDVSASMQGTDVSETRLARGVEVARSIVDSVPDARVGLLLFAGTSYPLALPTLDHDAVRFLLDGVTPTIATALDPGTLVSAAIESSIALLDRSDGLTDEEEDPDFDPVALTTALAVPDSTTDEPVLTGGERHIVLIGDGDTAEPDIRVQQVAAAAREEGVTIHTVSVGTVAGSGMVMPSGTYQLGGRIVDAQGNDAVSRLNEPMLEQTAAVGGGVHARGDDEDEVRALREVLGEPPESDDLGPNTTRPPWIGLDLPFALGVLALVALALEALLDISPFRARRGSVSKPRIPGVEALGSGR